MKELFLDDYAIESQRGLTAVLHQPMKRGVVLDSDRPWETLHAGYPNVIKTDDRWHLFYSAGWWDTSVKELGNPPDGASMGRGGVYCYAYSDDGLHWIKPSLRLGETPSGFTRGTPELDTPYPVVPTGMTLDNNAWVPVFPIDLSRLGMDDPKRRFLVSKSSTQTCERFPDFIRDKDWQTKLSPPISGAKEAPHLHVGTLCYEATSALWVVYGQFIAADSPDVVLGPQPHQSRRIARVTSKDMIHWEEQIVLQRDKLDHNQLTDCDEPMFLSVRREGGLTIGFITRFHSDRSDPRYTHPLPYVWRKGTTDIELRVTRDGVHWTRVGGGRAWIPHSTDERGFDRLVMMGWGGEGVRNGDELWFYYAAYDGDHMGHDRHGKLIDSDKYVRKGRIALATIRLDGYQSLRAGSEPGTLTTKPFTVQGEHLVINADAASHFRSGEIRVEVLDEQGQVISGFSRNDSQPMLTDAVEHDVTWQGGRNLSALIGRRVKLRFHLVRAELYSYAVFREDE